MIYLLAMKINPQSVSKYIPSHRSGVCQLVVYQAVDQAGLVSELPCAHTQTWEFQSIPQTQTLKTAANRYFSANLGKDTIHGAIGNQLQAVSLQEQLPEWMRVFLYKNNVETSCVFLVMMNHAIEQPMLLTKDRMPSFFMETPPETIRNTTSIIYCLPVSDNLPSGKPT